MAEILHDPNIVVIGGGTGSFTLLGALKEHTKNITAIVNMADDGGSTGVLRDELGVLPPGDIRQCLVALSESPQVLRELFNYRFPADTTFAGHSFGNLFLSAVEMMGSDFNEAVRLASEFLNITGRVLPITLSNCHLALKTTNGVMKGEYKIAHSNFDGRSDSPELWLEPEAEINPLAAEAIMSSDLVVIAPGNLYGSLVPALLVKGTAEALQATAAPVVYTCNLVNKPTQTQGFAVHDYVRELERFIGEGAIDVILYNTDEPSDEVLRAYALDGEYPVRIDEKELLALGRTAISGDFLAKYAGVRNKNDTFILRSLIRHDAQAIAGMLMQLVGQDKQ